MKGICRMVSRNPYPYFQVRLGEKWGLNEPMPLTSFIGGNFRRSAIVPHDPVN